MNGIGNGVAKDLTYTTRGHKLREQLLEGIGGGTRWRGTKGKIETTVIAQSIKYI